MHYFYIIFEEGTKGFILDEKHLPSEGRVLEQDKFFELAELVGKKLLTQTKEEVLKEIGYLGCYSIDTHKAAIDFMNLKYEGVLASSMDKKRKNTMYLISTLDRIMDFSQFPRKDPSIGVVFYENVEINDIKELGGYYMN